MSGFKAGMGGTSHPLSSPEAHFSAAVPADFAKLAPPHTAPGERGLVDTPEPGCHFQRYFPIHEGGIKPGK